MTETLTVRMPGRLVRELKAKARAQKTNPSAVLRRLASEYVQSPAGVTRNKLQDHIAAYAGTWDGYLSGEELLRRTRP